MASRGAILVRGKPSSCTAHHEGWCLWDQRESLLALSRKTIGLIIA